MKKIAAYIIVGIVLSAIGVLGYHIYNDFLESGQVRERIAVLPNLSDASVIFSPSDSLSPRPVIINYFNTRCRFCQAEIQSIQEHPKLSKKARVLLVSDEPKRRIKLYARNIGLDTSMVEVVWDSSGTIKKLYGVESVPVTFVYGKDSLLIESFKGETKADLLYELIE